MIMVDRRIDMDEKNKPFMAANCSSNDQNAESHEENRASG